MTAEDRHVIVVGAGVGGLRSALDLAACGCEVTVVERAAHIGGVLTRLDYQFPNDHCGMCRMLPAVEREGCAHNCLRREFSHDRIQILTHTEVIGISGQAGRFRATLRRSAPGVNPRRCIACGICSDVCPIETADAFNDGLTSRKAIYRPVAPASRAPFTIDLETCTRCGACQTACPTGAIDLAACDTFRILVVDDEAIMRQSLQDWLEDEGFSVATAASGAEALDHLAQMPVQLMLTDIKMPGMDGVELLRRALEAQPELKVILMTAYATVDTAVAAMKIGALDYLVKPFDTNDLIPMVQRVQQETMAANDQILEAAAIILNTGTRAHDPTGGKNVYGLGRLENVLTAPTLERLISAGGPTAGHAQLIYKGRPAQKIAWLQCVGSRDVQQAGDFCAGACCMYALKQAVQIKKRFGARMQTTLFYMDMRAFGKSHDQYRQRASQIYGVNLVRNRIHSLTADESTGQLLARYIDDAGQTQSEAFDLVALSTGQRPADLPEMPVALETNRWGFIQPQAFDPTRTSVDGIFCAGAGAAGRDIADTLIQSSAAAAGAAQLAVNAPPHPPTATNAASKRRNVTCEQPSILALICTCNDKLLSAEQAEAIAHRLSADPYVKRVHVCRDLCDPAQRKHLESIAAEPVFNRLLIGACHGRKDVRHWAGHAELAPHLAMFADIFAPPWPQADTGAWHGDTRQMITILQTTVEQLKHADPQPRLAMPMHQRALVIGGGIGGMQAALTLAGMGYPVDLVEVDDKLGGNLNWLRTTLDEQSPAEFNEQAQQAVRDHELITLHLSSRVVGTAGVAGAFQSVIAPAAGPAVTIDHGVVIVATGGSQASPQGRYHHGDSPAVITQQELEIALDADTIDLARSSGIAMIQCVGSRAPDRPYCSRICCNSSIKHALAIKKRQPDLPVYIFYRDMMTYGFNETYFTQARQAGVIFFQFTADTPPQVSLVDTHPPGVRISVIDPILGQPVEVTVSLLTLATGITAHLPQHCPQMVGINADDMGFFAEADPKWRPVESQTEGVFACGLALGPRSIPETVASAQAAAQRALALLAQPRICAGTRIALQRRSLCAQCERCIQACAFDARHLDPDTGVITVHPGICRGCGACMAVCPNGAAILKDCPPAQMLSIIETTLHAEPHIQGADA